ncbi:MAG: TonB-dependent receptor [Bacteroidales bacterium]|nr:TonB-dependent receptor [Bacteroidales bacterium]
MLKFKALIIFLIASQCAYSQSHTISGYVEDMNTGERIIGAYVIDSISKSVAQTNNYGFYIIKKLGSKVAIKATYIGLKSETKFLSLDHDSLINFKMQPAMELNEVVVVSSGYRHNVNAPLGTITIPIKLLTSIPALGESDLLKSIQSQPGIKGGMEGSAGIYVRGGSGGENLFMLDDVPMYNVSHLYGFFSAFNSSAIKDIKLIKGCFSAIYGGRASSVIDVRSLDGNNKSIKGEASIGFISSKLSLEGPLFSEKTTFMISARRSYFDLYSDALKHFKILDEDFPDYYFYDLNARITHTFSQKDKIFLSFYKGKDNIQNKNESTDTEGITETEAVTEIFKENLTETSGWGNIIGSLRWNHAFGNSMFANTTLAYSSYDYFTQNKYISTDNDLTQNTILEESYIAKYKSNISDVIIKTDFDYSISNNHKLLFGLGNTFHTFRPGENNYYVNDPKNNKLIDTSYTNSVIHASEPFFYVEDEIKVTEKLNINAGLRLSGLISNSKAYVNSEPRISINYAILPQLVFKTGYSRMVQYIHLLTSSGLIMPNDIWVPALRELQPLKSDQINAGISYDLNKKLLFSIEVYQKWLNNTTDYRNGSSLLADLSPWYEKTTQGYGNAKGIEVSIEKQQGKLTGSINYTLSKASRTYAALNNGQTYPFRYDRLHDFNISVNYQIFKKWDISALWVYGTGYPVTVPVEKYGAALGTYITDSYGDGGEVIGYYPSLNNYRLPAYHRLDIGIHRKSHNRLGDQTLSLDIFNVYNRKNPVNMSFFVSRPKYVYLLPIIPTFTYTLKF